MRSPISFSHPMRPTMLRQNKDGSGLELHLRPSDSVIGDAAKTAV